jgi:TonB family protein
VTPDFVEPTPVDDTLLANNEPGPAVPGVLDGDPRSTCVGADCIGTEPTDCRGPSCRQGGFVDLPRTIVPIALHAPQPAYPAVARLQGRQGVVVVEILVGIDGKVSAARLVEGAAPFDAAALAAVRGWRYQPVFVDGQAIAWKSTITLKFQLK